MLRRSIRLCICVWVYFLPLTVCVCEGECGGLRKGGRAGGRPCLCSPKYLLLAPCFCSCFPFFLSLSLFFFSNLCTSIARGSDRGPIMTIVYTNRTVQQYPAGGRVGRVRRRTNPIPGLDRQAHSSTRGPPPRIEGLFYGCFNTSSVSVYRADDDALGEPEKVTMLLPE